MSIDFDLAALPEGLAELGLSDPDSYQDELPPAPPRSGNYRFRITDAQLLTNAEGRPLLADEKFPQVKVNAVQIVEPEEMADRLVYIWQTFSYKPYSNRPTSNKVADLLRAHDRSLTWSDSTDGIRRLLEVIEAGQTFCAKLDWVAKDTQWYREERERTGGDYKSVPFNAWILRGQNSFPKDDKGNPIPLWEGPSGDKIEARAELKSLFSSDKDTKLIQL